MIRNGLFKETNEQRLFSKTFYIIFNENHFDKMNKVIKISSTIHDIFHHVMWTPAIKGNMKKKTACFKIYFSLREIYDNNKTKVKIL